MSSKLVNLLKNWFKISDAPYRPKLLFGALHPLVECYGNKGTENIEKGFKEHYKKYPNLKYNVIDNSLKVGKDETGEWCQCYFERTWDDPETGEKKYFSSKENGIIEKIWFNKDGLILKIELIKDLTN